MFTDNHMSYEVYQANSVNGFFTIGACFKETGKDGRVRFYHGITREEAYPVGMMIWNEETRRYDLAFRKTSP